MGAAAAVGSMGPTSPCHASPTFSKNKHAWQLDSVCDMQWDLMALWTLCRAGVLLNNVTLAADGDLYSQGKGERDPPRPAPSPHLVSLLCTPVPTWG